MRTVRHVIIGGGLAGLVLGHFLRRLDVVVLDPSPAGYKIGESLIPELFRHPELQSLLPEVQALPSFTPKRGTTFVSHSSVASFPLAPEEAGVSMHVYRPELEALMQRKWRVPVEQARVRAIDFDRRIVTTDTEDIHFTGQVLDCSGPAMVVASLLNEVSQVAPVHARWSYFDVANYDRDAWAQLFDDGSKAFGHYDPRHRFALSAAPDPDWEPGHTTILSRADNGDWTWQIPLYGGRVMSFGAVSRHGPVSHESYLEAVCQTAAPCFELRRRPEGSSPLDRVHVRDGFARRAKRAASRDFVLLSDAFAFSDPVYSVGTGFAVNQAITIARRLHSGDWSDTAVERFCERSNALHDRAKHAFDLWYRGEVLSDPCAAETVQDDMLRGGIFREQLTERYGNVLNDADLPGERDPFQPRIASRPLTATVRPLVATLQNDWALDSAMPCAGGLRTEWLRGSSGERLSVLVSASSDALPHFQRVDRVVLSYMQTADDHVPMPVVQQLMDDLVDVVRRNEDQWLEMAAPAD